MIWTVGTVAIVLHILCAAAAGGGLVVGFVFFLIGFAPMKEGSKSLARLLWSKDTLMIAGTMSVVLIFFLLSFWNLRMIGSLTFPGMTGTSAEGLTGSRVLTGSILYTIWALLALYVLLPHVFNFRGMGWKIPLFAISAGVVSIWYGILSMT